MLVGVSMVVDGGGVSLDRCLVIIKVNRDGRSLWTTVSCHGNNQWSDK